MFKRIFFWRYWESRQTLPSVASRRWIGWSFTAVAKQYLAGSSARENGNQHVDSTASAQWISFRGAHVESCWACLFSSDGSGRPSWSIEDVDALTSKPRISCQLCKLTRYDWTESKPMIMTSAHQSNRRITRSSASVSVVEPSDDLFSMKV